jgi:hypothetical protein
LFQLSSKDFSLIITTSESIEELNQKVENFCDLHKICQSELEGLSNLVVSSVEGEKINNKCKYFIALIQLLFNTDELL